MADLEMFKSFLIEYADPFTNSIPFLNKVKKNWSDIQLFTNLAGGELLGLGLYFQEEWKQWLWSDTQLFADGFRPNIALLELYAIVLAVEVWKEKVKGKSIVLRSDSQVTCFFINKMKAHISAAMDLLRHHTKTCLLLQGRAHWQCKKCELRPDFQESNDHLLQEKSDCGQDIHPTAIDPLATTMNSRTDEEVSESLGDSGMWTELRCQSVSNGSNPQTDRMLLVLSIPNSSSMDLTEVWNEIIGWE